MKPHIHKYKRVIIGSRKIERDPETGKRRIINVPGTEVFRCMLRGCTHYKPRALVVGLESICWNCGEPLELTVENTRLVKPTHAFCRKVLVKSAGAENEYTGND